MSSPTNTATAGGVQLVGTPGRAAPPERAPGDMERNDPHGGAAPPLSDEQRAAIRTAFHQPEARRAA